jgi:hypothetical protein
MRHCPYSNGVIFRLVLLRHRRAQLNDRFSLSCPSFIERGHGDNFSIILNSRNFEIKNFIFVRFLQSSELKLNGKISPRIIRGVLQSWPYNCTSLYDWNTAHSSCDINSTKKNIELPSLVRSATGCWRGKTPQMIVSNCCRIHCTELGNGRRGQCFLIGNSSPYTARDSVNLCQ